MTVAVGSWVLGRVDLTEALAAWSGGAPWVFLAPAVLLLLNTCLHAFRLQLLLKAAGAPTPYPQVLDALLKAAFVGLVLPRGGSDLAKAGYLARASGRAEAAVVSLFVTRIAELVPWTLFLLYGLSTGLFARDRLVGTSAIVFSVGFSSAIVLTMVAAWVGPTVGHRLPGRLGQLAVRAADAGTRLTRQPGAVAVNAALALPFAFVNCSVVWVLLHGFGHPVPIADILALIPAADTVISLPVTISGIGLREAVFVRVLTPWGVTEATAVAIALTRFSGELSRAAVGGLLFILGDTVGPGAPRAAPRPPQTPS